MQFELIIFTRKKFFINILIFYNYMGTVLSTILLLGGTLASGVLSSMSANYAREQNLSSSKTYALYSALVAIVLILLTLFLTIKSKMGGGAFTGIFEGFAIGVMLAFLLLTIVLFATLTMNFMGIMAANNDDEAGALKYGALSAAVCFIGFIIALLLILFLL